MTFEPLVDERVPALGDHLLLERELDPARRRVLGPRVELDEAGQRLLRLLRGLRRGQLDREPRAPLAGDLGADALLLERRPQVARHAVQHVLDALLEVHAEDQMDPALEVQPQVDRLAGLPCQSRGATRRRDPTMTAATMPMRSQR